MSEANKTDYEQQALLYAERYGIIIYEVEEHLMKYHEHFQSEGTIEVIYDLDAKKEVSRRHLPAK